MDAEQVGMYWLLISVAWQEKPRGTLPDNEKTLAKYARVSVEVWREKSDIILKCFKNKNGRIIHTRLKRESRKKEQWIKKCKAGGIKSGKVRAKVSSTTLEAPIPLSLSLNPSIKRLRDSIPIYKKVKDEYIKELIALYPKVNPVKVIEKLHAWELDKKRETKNPSLRLRNWFENELKYSGEQTPDQQHDLQKKATACYGRQPDEYKNNPGVCTASTGPHCKFCEKKKQSNGKEG